MLSTEEILIWRLTNCLLIIVLFIGAVRADCVLYTKYRFDVFE